jgi:hypothetical protein
MQNKTTTAKPNYQVALRDCAKTVYGDAKAAGAVDLSIDIIYQALKDVALESWRNGIEAGRRKASKSAGSPKQSYQSYRK